MVNLKEDMSESELDRKIKNMIDQEIQKAIEEHEVLCMLTNLPIYFLLLVAIYFLR